MKKSTSKLLIGLAVGVLLAGGIGAIAYGSNGFTNSDISTWFDGDWRAIKIENQTKDYTGSKLEPDVTLPEGFTYEIVKIEKDGEEVSLETGAVASGDYVFTLKVTKTKTEESREYFANLTIFAEDELPTEIKAKNLSLTTKKVQALSNGDIVKTIGYSVQPNDADPNIKIESILMDGADASSYISGEILLQRKEIQLTCKKAFGSKITIKVVHQDNPNVSATITCDYQKKLLGKSFSSKVDYAKVVTNEIVLDVYKIYEQGLTNFSFKPSEMLLQDFSYSVGTIEYEKKSISSTCTENFGNNYSTSSTLTTLVMSNGNSQGMKWDSNVSFTVNKSLVNGVYGLTSNFTIASMVFNDETGAKNNFIISLDSSGSYLESMNVNSSNVVF